MLNRVVYSGIANAKELTNSTCDSLGILALETVGNKSVDYEYNELNQLVKKTTSQNEVYTYSYDKRGNRTAETGKKASQSFVYDATNRMVEGTNWKGDTSAYTYNGLGLRVNNLVTTHAGQTYERDYVIDYTSPENDDLYVYALGNGQLEYEQRHVYAGSERIEQITEKGNGGWERTLYVHEDVMGNTRYYTKATGQTFAELQYDAWGQPVSPNKLVSNDHGNYVFATFTGHIYDTTLDIYFAEARFYDATSRTWLAMDPIKDGLNWYQYCLSNPTTNWDPTGLAGESYFSSYSGCDNVLLTDWTLGPDFNDILRDELREANSWMYRIIEFIAGGYFIGGASSALLAAFAAGGAVALPVAGVAAATIFGLVLVVDAVTGTTAAISENYQALISGNNGNASQDSSGHMLGESGTQVRGSKTTGQNGKTERVDVENPAPGKRPADLHYHDPSNNKWRYDVGSGNLINPKTGELAPPKVQKVTGESWFQRAIEKGLQILGE